MVHVRMMFHSLLALLKYPSRAELIVLKDGHALDEMMSHGHEWCPTQAFPCYVSSLT